MRTCGLVCTSVCVSAVMVLEPSGLLIKGMRLEMVANLMPPPPRPVSLSHTHTHLRAHSCHRALFRPFQSHSAQSHSPLEEVHTAISREKTTCPAVLCMKFLFKHILATNHCPLLLHTDDLTLSPSDRERSSSHTPRATATVPAQLLCPRERR